MNLSVIVCPVDFSESGRAALRSALRLAQCHEAELHVVYVRPRRLSRSSAGFAAAEKRLVEFISTSDAKGVVSLPVILTGEPVRAVAEYARLKSADLVVVGPNGPRGSRFWSSGVLAAEIARAVASPTLAASKEAGLGTGVSASFNNILCAVDLSAPSLRALSAALTLAQRSGGRITLLHVIEHGADVDTIERDLRHLVPSEALDWCEVETQVVTGIAHDAIVASARAQKADLVVIGRPEGTTPVRITMASTLSGVLRHARCAVVAIPGPSQTTEVTAITSGAAGYADEASTVLTAAATYGVAPHSAPRHVEAL